MIFILCSVSAVDYNDDVVPGLAHFALLGHLKETPHYAAYVKEKGYVRITCGPIEEMLVYPQSSEKNLSPHFSCVRSLIDNQMNYGDTLYADRVDDLGDTACEAMENYFAAVEKGITLAFYDCPYLDSEPLGLKGDIDSKTKSLITILAEVYFKLKANGLALDTAGDVECIAEGSS